MMIKSKVEKIQSFVTAFKKIQEATGVKTLDDFVSRFLTIEDDNFKLFNHINVLQEEAEEIESEISDTAKELSLLIDTTADTRKNCSFSMRFTQPSYNVSHAYKNSPPLSLVFVSCV